MLQTYVLYVHCTCMNFLVTQLCSVYSSHSVSVLRHQVNTLTRAHRKIICYMGVDTGVGELGTTTHTHTAAHINYLAVIVLLYLMLKIIFQISYTSVRLSYTQLNNHAYSVTFLYTIKLSSIKRLVRRTS